MALEDLTKGTKKQRKVKTVLLVEVGKGFDGDVDRLLGIDVLDREATATPHPPPHAHLHRSHPQPPRPLLLLPIHRGWTSCPSLTPDRFCIRLLQLRSSYQLSVTGLCPHLSLPLLAHLLPEEGGQGLLGHQLVVEVTRCP